MKKKMLKNDRKVKGESKRKSVGDNEREIKKKLIENASENASGNERKSNEHK